MEKKERFSVHKLSDAAYLEGVLGKKCVDLAFDPENSSRILFIFEIEPEEGERLVLGFGSSESFKFDSSVKNLKGRLFNKLRERSGAPSARYKV